MRLGRGLGSHRGHQPQKNLENGSRNLERMQKIKLRFPAGGSVRVDWPWAIKYTFADFYLAPGRYQSFGGRHEQRGPKLVADSRERATCVAAWENGEQSRKFYKKYKK